MQKANVAILPYSSRSMSAKEIKKALDIRTLGYDFVGDPSKLTIINWGNGGVNVGDLRGYARIINKPAAVSKAVDKRKFFELMAKNRNAPRLPPWTLNNREAVEWAKTGIVMGRERVQGTAGRGIVFYGECDLREFLNCKLFTKFIPDTKEFRLHFAFGQIIDEQRKGLRNGLDASKVETRVKSHRNGYVFIRQNVVVPPDVYEQGKRAYEASGLDFCALDIIYSPRDNKAYVLEANTAPGIEGTTVTRYAEAFKANL